MNIGLRKDRLSGCGGMADAQDSKSCGGNLVWVQVPPSALNQIIKTIENSSVFNGFFFVYIRNGANMGQTSFYTIFIFTSLHYVYLSPNIFVSQILDLY